MKYGFSKKILYIGICISAFFSGFMQSGKVFGSGEYIYKDVLEKILYDVLTDRSSDLEEVVISLRLVNKQIQQFVDRILLCHRDSDISRKLIHRYLMFSLERCVQYAITHLKSEDQEERSLEEAALRSFCFEGVQLPYVEEEPPFLNDTEKSYKKFLYDCRNYLYIKSFSSYMTYYGESFEDMEEKFENYVSLLGCHKSVLYGSNIQIEHVTCDITYLPLIYPSLYGHSPQATEVIIKITGLNTDAFVYDDIAVYENEGSSKTYWEGKWESFWQNFINSSEGLCVDEITLSFWSLDVIEGQFNSCIKSIPEELLKKFIRLDFTSCNFKQVPRSIERLYNLQWLDCWGNNLQRIPQVIEKHKFLQRLELGKNFITTIEIEEEDMPDLHNLLTFSCRNSKIKNICIPLFKLPRLRFLDLQSNQFKEVVFKDKNEDGDRVYSYLRHLDLSRGKLKSLSKIVGKIKTLEDINLGYNDFKSNSIRSTILKLPKLKKLTLPEKFVVPERQKDLYKNLIENPIESPVITSVPGWVFNEINFYDVTLEDSFAEDSSVDFFGGVG